MSDPPTSLTFALRDAVAAAPGSLRALARAAGVPHTTLVRVSGGSLRATPALAERVAEALERWGEDCKRHGYRLRQELYLAERERAAPYDARRGGHAPEALREAFARWVGEGAVTAGPGRWTIVRTPRMTGVPVRPEWLLGQLWNCTDALSPECCDALGLPRRSTHARAARLLMRRALRETVIP